jgi:hypothetical protein
MNKIKFTNYNVFGQPQNAILRYNDGETVVLDKITTSSYYDSVDKSCRSYPKFYKINNILYA